jgi:hypothetical protein
VHEAAWTLATISRTIKTGSTSAIRNEGIGNSNPHFAPLKPRGVFRSAVARVVMPSFRPLSAADLETIESRLRYKVGGGNRPKFDQGNGRYCLKHGADWGRSSPAVSRTMLAMWRFADGAFTPAERSLSEHSWEGAKMEASATLTIPRMFSDAAGECRFDQTDIPLVMKEYAPPAAPVTVSTPIQTGQCVFMRIPPGFVGVQHPLSSKAASRVCVRSRAFSRQR